MIAAIIGSYSAHRSPVSGRVAAVSYNGIMKRPITRVRSVAAVALLLLTVVVLGCGSGIPEIRPGYFDQPTSIETHGRIVEKHYRLSRGIGTEGSVDYIIIEVDGSPVRIPNGYIKDTKYCEVHGVDAVALQVRGSEESAGFYIFQLDGDKQIFERLCDYKMFMGDWEGPKFRECDTDWDAENKTRVKSCGATKRAVLIPATMKPQWINIEYGNPKCPPATETECNQEFVVPESGFVCTSTPDNKGWWYADNYFLVDKDGKRTLLNYEDIWQKGTISLDQPALETGTGKCKVTLSQFFYGKQTDVRSTNTIFQNEDFLNNYHPQCKY